MSVQVQNKHLSVQIHRSFYIIPDLVLNSPYWPSCYSLCKLKNQGMWRRVKKTVIGSGQYKMFLPDSFASEATGFSVVLQYNCLPKEIAYLDRQFLVV